MMLQLSNSVASKQVRNSGNIVRYTVLSADALSDFAKMSRDVTCDTVAHLSWKDWFHRRFEMLHTVWQLDVIVKIHKEGRCGRWSCNIFIFLNADDLFDLDILFFLKSCDEKLLNFFSAFPLGCAILGYAMRKSAGIRFKLECTVPMETSSCSKYLRV